MKSKQVLRIRLVAGMALLLAGSGCGLWDQQQATRSTGIMSFLYPDEARPKMVEAVPRLELPLRVGLAFAPEVSTGWRRTGLPEASRVELLEAVRAHFEQLPFVEDIQVIPAGYLRPKGGFQNLDQLRSLLGIDVIALVSYDQVQFTWENIRSFAYWTIVGTHLVRGQENSTHTLLEAGVFHIESRRLLFRAPGTSEVAGRSTLVRLEEQWRQDSEEGFKEAVARLSANLHREVLAFQVRLRKGPGEFQIAHRPGYTGAGRLGWLPVLVILAAMVLGRRMRLDHACS
ncbi:MAG: rhombotarget lipoprotein [Puniceicoccaceae bacterium]|nr:MAG: rhombotarget lipoprotein [Puniceicoccaceae bacterium]